MALPSSGPITMAQVAAEIGISASGLSLDDSRVRTLAGRPSGSISMSDLLGKAWAYANFLGISTSGRASAYYNIWGTIHLNIDGVNFSTSAQLLSGNNQNVRKINETTYEWKGNNIKKDQTGTYRFTVTAGGTSSSRDITLSTTHF